MIREKRRVTRLFVERDLDTPTLALDERGAHYLGHVLRLKRGDELVAFNGAGIERRARVDTLQRRGATLELSEHVEPLPESPLDLALLQALPKSDAMDLIVQKATELGVRTLQPVYTEFSVVKLGEDRSARRLQHWRRIAEGACEQCGRHRPLTVAPAKALAEALLELPASAARLTLDAEGAERLADRPRPAASIVLAVGPEGGFGPADLRALERGAFTTVSLGKRVLRAETAALAACTLAQALWGDL